MATGAYYLAVTYAERLPPIAGGHAAWRYVLLLGLAPALVLAAVRPFLPETRLRSAALRLHVLHPAHRPAAAVPAATRVSGRAPHYGANISFSADNTAARVLGLSVPKRFVRRCTSTARN